MSRKSDSMDLGFGTLGIGISSTHFQIAGTDPCLMLALKIEQIGFARIGAHVFRTQLGISSGPGVLCKQIFSNSASTWWLVMMNSSGKPSTGALSNCRGGESLETLRNEEAIISASSRPFLNSLRERYLSVDQILINQPQF